MLKKNSGKESGSSSNINDIVSVIMYLRNLATDADFPKEKLPKVTVELPNFSSSNVNISGKTINFNFRNKDFSEKNLKDIEEMLKNYTINNQSSDRINPLTGTSMNVYRPVVVIDQDSIMYDKDGRISQIKYIVSLNPIEREL